MKKMGYYVNIRKRKFVKNDLLLVGYNMIEVGDMIEIFMLIEIGFFFGVIFIN